MREKYIQRKEKKNIYIYLEGNTLIKEDIKKRKKNTLKEEKIKNKKLGLKEKDIKKKKHWVKKILKRENIDRKDH